MVGLKRGQFSYKLVIVVREDLKLSPGKLAAQVAHASVTCALECSKKRKAWFDGWYAEGQRKVVLGAADETGLRAIERSAKGAGLISVVIEDAGLTEIPPGTMTCIGIGPAPENVIDKLTGSLPLL